MSRFCCFSMTNPNPTDASQSECSYFGHPNFTELFSSPDGKNWCAFHAPLELTAGQNTALIPEGHVLFSNAMRICGIKGLGFIDLRRNVWRTDLTSREFNIFRQIGLTKEINMNGAIFAGSVAFDSDYYIHNFSFDHALFCKESNFKSLAVPCSFRGAKFVKKHQFLDSKESIDYSGCIFEDGFRVDATGVSGNYCNYNFNNAHCLEFGKFTSSEHSYSNVSFRKFISTKSVVISTTMDRYRFNIDFSDSKFDEKLTITGGYKSITLDGSNIGSLAVHTKVEEKLSGLGITCRGSASFSESSEGVADFSECVFKGYVDFANFQFGDDALFRDTEFNDACSFKKASFNGISDFSRARFLGPVNWVADDEGQKLRKLILDRAYFKSSISFTNRVFSGPLSCQKSVFSLAPDFHGCEFHQDTSFKGARFSDVTRDEATAAYRTLKLAMESLRAKDEESRFYSLEQRSWRNNVKDAPFAKAFSALYDWGSDYGRSIGKPIGWMLGSFVFFLIIYFHGYAAEAYCVSGPAEKLGKLEIVARYQLTQLVRPFEALTFRNSELGQAKNCVIPFWLACVSAFQTLLQLSLIALLLLAIRRRFKME